MWRWLACRFDARRLVFVDESGFHTSMTRLRARAPRGKRAYGKVPRNRGKNTTLIASITLEEHREAFEEEFGEEVSTSTIGRAIAGLPGGPWPLKKSHR